MTVELPDDHDSPIVASEILENDVYRLIPLEDTGYEIKYCIDLGAHCGLFAVALHALWPYAKVCCFEPFPALARLCSKNAPWTNVVTAAVRYDDKKEYFTLPGHTAGGMMYDPTVNADPSIPDRYEKHQVITTRLDPFITSRVDLLKVDIEGTEKDLFEHLPMQCAKHIRRIIGEYHFPEGYCGVERLLRAKFPHLEPRFLGKHKSEPISYFEAVQYDFEKVLCLVCDIGEPEDKDLMYNGHSASCPKRGK